MIYILKEELNWIIKIISFYMNILKKESQFIDKTIFQNSPFYHIYIKTDKMKKIWIKKKI